MCAKNIGIERFDKAVAKNNSAVFLAVPLFALC